MKRNRISLDFTSLLDITMIILFWFMIKYRASAEEVQAKAQEQIDNIQSVSAQLEADRADFEAEKQEWSQKADAEMKRIENADKSAAVNQKALEALNDNILLDIKLSTEKSGNKWKKTISVYNGKNHIGDIEFEKTSDTDITGEISSMLEAAGLQHDSTIIGIFIYDGDQYATALTVNDIIRSIRKVSEEYPQFYCASINISE